MFEFLEKAYAASDVNPIYLLVDMKWDRYPLIRALLTLARCGFTADR